MAIMASYCEGSSFRTMRYGSARDTLASREADACNTSGRTHKRREQHAMVMCPTYLSDSI